jgi:hypothetical protein
LQLRSLEDPHESIQHIVLDLNSSKADRHGKGRYLSVSRDQGSNASHIIDVAISFCLRAGHRLSSEPLLSRYWKGRHKKLHRGMVSSALKTAATHFGFDSLYFSSHSLRIGAATCGEAAGRSRPSLCRMGGWSLNSNSDGLYRHATPQDTGILSARDQGSYLLCTDDLMRMVPTFTGRPRSSTR